MATKAELAQKVGEKLGVVESGETIDSNDSTIIQEKYDSLYYVMKADDLVSWGSGDDIPTAAVTSVVSIVANDCFSEFIIPQDKQMAISRDAIDAKGNLRMLENIDYVPEELEPHYY